MEEPEIAVDYRYNLVKEWYRFTMSSIMRCLNMISLQKGSLHHNLSYESAFRNM